MKVEGGAVDAEGLRCDGLGRWFYICLDYLNW